MKVVLFKWGRSQPVAHKHELPRAIRQYVSHFEGRRVLLVAVGLRRHASRSAGEEIPAGASGSGLKQ